VLQQGAWPLGNNTLSPLNVPYELEKAVQMVMEGVVPRDPPFHNELFSLFSMKNFMQSRSVDVN
jgi:hypothetical protein